MRNPIADQPLKAAARETPVLTLNIYSVDEDTDEEIRIGKAEYGPGGMLTVVQADPDQAEFLNNVADNLNRKVAMVEKLPGLESSRYGLSSRAVQRTDPEFLAVLQNYLKTYYGLSLG